MTYRVMVAALFALIAAATAAVRAQDDSAGKRYFGPSYSCAVNLSNVPYSFDTYNGDIATHVIARDPEAKAVLLKGSHEDEARAVASVETCAAGPKRDLLRAYVAAWRAALDWYDDNDAWRDDLNLSDQLFRACSKREAGTMLGAHCETMIQQNARRRLAWNGS